MRSMSVPDKEHPSLRRGPQRQRVLYPMLPSILDEDSLSAVCTLESAELAFARRQGRSRNQYLHALYLKAMASLGHSHFQPKDLPRQFRQRIAEQLDLEADLGRLLSIERREKSRIVTTVRAFLGLAALSRQEKENVLQWLQDGLAKKETDMAVLINAAIERFKALHVEIPAWDVLQSLVQRALSQAKASALKSIDQGLDEEDGLRLDALVDGKDGKTVFDFLKNPVPQASARTVRPACRPLYCCRTCTAQPRAEQGIAALLYCRPARLFARCRGRHAHPDMGAHQAGRRLARTPSWNASYQGKIEDHYAALRRFLPARLVSAHTAGCHCSGA